MACIDEVVEQVLSQNEKFFGFTLTCRSDIPVGAEIYILEKNDDGDPDAEPITVTFSGGKFFSSSGEGDYLDLEDVPEKLNFVRTDISGLIVEDMQVESTLRSLLGIGDQGVCEECESIRHATGKNTFCSTCLKGFKEAAS